MARIVVVGGGVAGLGSALALARGGHRVTVLERDATPLPSSPDEAFEWDRRGAPQVRHSHALLARLHNLLRDRFPDVLAALLDAGASELRMTDNLPDTMSHREPMPGDDDLVLLACRRTTFEWVLRRIVLATERVEVLDGVVVEHLAGEQATDAHPAVVNGVRAVRDDAALDLAADIVVVAAGRRGAVPAWLEELGVVVPEAVEDTGIVYLSRFYRLHPGVDPPPADGPIGGDLGYLKFATFVGDNRTFSVTLAVGNHDDELRSRLLHADAFERAARLLPVIEPWVDHSRAEPITPVHVMARLLNRIRRFQTTDGRPTVLGLHAVGDAHTCTNPLYGRGCSLAMVQATLVADAIAAHGDDAAAVATAYEAACGREIEPWYHAAVAQDRTTRELAAAADRGDEPPPGDLRYLIRDGLAPAMRTDGVVLRAFLRTFNLLQPPDALLQDAHVMARVMAAFNDRDNRAPEPPLGPPRDALLAALSS